MSQKTIFSVKGLPVLQNRMFSTIDEALRCPVGDIELVQDMDTGLIFNSAFVSDKLVYDVDYQNEQACSGVFQGHLNDVTEIIDRHFQDQSLIEVGCGKGYFLDHLQALKYLITGVDPAYEGANQSVVKAHFERSLGLSADGVVLRHVLEHIEDPVSFISSIAHANGGKGLIYIEVPCFDWICRHRAWFDIFYEHVNYFRLPDFYRMFSSIVESGYVFGGQYLYVVADLASLRVPHWDPKCATSMSEDFLSDVDNIVSVAQQGPQNVIWGGASKGVIFAIYMERAGVSIDYVIDVNPAKQGKYLAGSGLRVSAPEEAMASMNKGCNVFVMNSNYFDEIVEQSCGKYKYYRVDNE